MKGTVNWPAVGGVKGTVNGRRSCPVQVFVVEFNDNICGVLHHRVFNCEVSTHSEKLADG